MEILTTVVGAAMSNTGMAVMSGAMSAIGAIRQSNAAAAQAQSQANAAQYNATVDRNNAQVAMDQANVKEEAQRRHFAMLQGQAIAGAAQSGAGLNGSNADVLEQNALNNELDALTIRYEGQQQATGLLNQSNMEQYKAAQYERNSSDAQTSGYINAGANLLSGYTKYAYYKNGGKLAD